MKNTWKCVKCQKAAEQVLLPIYEHECTDLTDVAAVQCQNCKEFFFDEKQILIVEKRVKVIKARTELKPPF